MEFTGLMMYSYFDKCLLHNALEEWHSVMPHDDDQTVKNFKFSFEQWFTALQPNNVFLAQTEWMINTMRKSDIMKVKGFGNRLKTLIHYLTLMPHDDDNDTVFTGTNFKALLLKSMPSSWQNACLSKGTCTSENFWQMLSYFVQLQSITDNQTVSKAF